MEQHNVEALMLERVCSALARVDRRLGDGRLRDLDASLVDDFGLDSVRFIELTLDLEESLGIAELPLQRWSDAEAERTTDRFTLRSLVAFCLAHTGGAE